MSTLLVIQAHPHIENSLSLMVGKQFVDAYKETYPNYKVINRQKGNPHSGSRQRIS